MAWNVFCNLNDSVLYNFMYSGDPFALPSLLPALKLAGVVPVSHELCMCMNVPLRAGGSHTAFNTKPASVPDTLAEFFFLQCSH